MKSKEEIEQLAEQYTQNGIYLSDSEKQQTEIAYMTGYTKCQEDMADMRYTEKQLLDAMSFAECYIIEHDKPLFLKSDGKPVPDCLEYISSLNKQDI